MAKNDDMYCYVMRESGTTGKLIKKKYGNLKFEDYKKPYELISTRQRGTTRHLFNNKKDKLIKPKCIGRNVGTLIILSDPKSKCTLNISIIADSFSNRLIYLFLFNHSKNTKHKCLFCSKKDFFKIHKNEDITIYSGVNVIIYVGLPFFLVPCIYRINANQELELKSPLDKIDPKQFHSKYCKLKEASKPPVMETFYRGILLCSYEKNIATVADKNADIVLTILKNFNQKGKNAKSILKEVVVLKTLNMLAMICYS